MIFAIHDHLYHEKASDSSLKESLLVVAQSYNLIVSNFQFLCIQQIFYVDFQMMQFSHQLVLSLQILMSKLV